ncbi:hypothetical protein MAHJHV57_50600 [Mycobacterium avium subsp. hominissuis]
MATTLERMTADAAAATGCDLIRAAAAASAVIRSSVVATCRPRRCQPPTPTWAGTPAGGSIVR